MASSSSSSSPSPLTLLTDLVGAQLKIVTNDEEIIVGELFAFDAGFVALVQDTGSVGDGKYGFKMFNTAHVKQVSVIKPPAESKLCENIGDISPFLTVEYLERAKDIERKALNIAIRESNQINPAVTSFGQQIFNSIAKT